MRTYRLTVDAPEDVIPFMEGMPLPDWRQWLKLPPDERRRLPRVPPPPPVPIQRQLFD